MTVLISRRCIIEVGVLLAVLLSCGCSTRDNLAPKVTAEAVRSIQLGMSAEEVKSVLGEPVEQDTWGLKYAYEPDFAREYPTLSVTLRDGRVAAVWAIRNYAWGFNDQPVYYVSADGSGERPEFQKLFAPR